MHTHFRIDSSKGSVYLFNPQGEIEERLDLKKQIEPNVSYGRIGDGSNEWGYLTISTPGNSNNGVTSSSVLAPEPIFSHKGFVGVAGKDKIVLTVELPESSTADNVLCVTTNGSEPQAADAVDGGRWESVVESTTVVRAKIFGKNLLPRRSTTHSYIFHPRETELRVVSIVTNDSYFYDETEGIMVGESGNHPNWENDWRRPINIEIFEGMCSEAAVNQLAETRIQGGASRQEPQKSLAVYSNKRFGTKRFYTQLWEDKPNVTEPQSFLLRNGGNAFGNSRINDALGQTIIGRNSHAADWQAYTPAIYYINGKYMGITDIRERSNDDYVAANYDGLEDIDMLENHWEVKAGSSVAYKSLLDYIESDEFTAEHLAQLVDFDNFLDMMVIKVFGHDTDFPGNNIVSWKSNAENSKWRFIIKDIDRLGIWWMGSKVEDDYYEHLVTTNENPTLRHYCYLFTRFYEHPDLYPLFLDRMAIYMGDMLATEHAQSIIDEMCDAIQPEYLDHLSVYYPSDFQRRYDSEHGWPGSVEYLRNEWWPRRIEAVYGHLKKHYALGEPIPMTINRDNKPIVFNGIELSQPVWNGKYFAGRIINLSTVEDEYCWVVQTYKGDNTPAQQVYANEAVFSIPTDAKKVEVFLASRDASLESNPNHNIHIRREGHSVIIESTSEIEWVEIYDTLGRMLHNSTLNSCNTCIEVNSSFPVLIVKVKTKENSIHVAKSLIKK